MSTSVSVFTCVCFCAWTNTMMMSCGPKTVPWRSSKTGITLCLWVHPAIALWSVDCGVHVWAQIHSVPPVFDDLYDAIFGPQDEPFVLWPKDNVMKVVKHWSNLQCVFTKDNVDKRPRHSWCLCPNIALWSPSNNTGT